MGKKITLLLFLGILVAVILIPNAPAFHEYPNRDSGTFLYTAEQILRGRIPYRDVWDHKPPGIYYINALGLLIGGGSRWGVWVLEFLSVYAAAVLGFSLLQQAFGVIPAVFGSAGWLMSLVFVLQDGNYAEGYALLFQFVALFAFWRLWGQRDSFHWAVLMGLSGAACFLLRQNLIGVPLSAAALIALSDIPGRWKRALCNVSKIGLSAVGILAMVALYFAAHNALTSLIDATFGYSFVYASLNRRGVLPPTIAGLSTLAPSGISILALAAWNAGVLYLLCCRHQIGSGKPLLYVSLVALPVEFYLSSVSGRTFAHYYMAWLPVFAVLIGFFAYGVIKDVTRRLELTRQYNASVLWLLALLLAMGYVPGKTAWDNFWQMRKRPVGYPAVASEAVDYIRAHTTPDDYVLVWGAEATVNFLAHRQAPTRYVYQYPLYVEYGYQNPASVREFLNDLMINKPALIVDTSGTNGNVPPLDYERRRKWRSFEEEKLLEGVFDYIATHYQLVDTIGSAGGQWFVHAYVGG